MVTIRSAGLAGILCLALGACSQLAPTEAAPAAGPNGIPDANEVGVCYSSSASTPAQVAALATDQCPTGTKAKWMSQGWDLDACPVLMPVRATFECAAR
jgi:hypothetical protein